MGFRHLGVSVARRGSRISVTVGSGVTRTGGTTAAAVIANAAARDTIPAKLPANVIDPDAKVALLRTGRRGLQMVLRLLAASAVAGKFGPVCSGQGLWCRGG